MSEVTIIFPNQLFAKHPAVDKSRQVYLVEEFLFFRQYCFLRQKLVYQRACMQRYKKHLEDKGLTVKYIEAVSDNNNIADLLTTLAKQGVKAIHYAHVYDDWLEQRIRKTTRQNKLEVYTYDSDYFLSDYQSDLDYKVKKNNYYHADYYEKQRKSLEILIDKEGNPKGGKWSFDAENRKKLPKGIRLSYPELKGAGKYVKEAIEYVEENFAGNPGQDMVSLDKSEGYYPIDHASSREWLQVFLEERFRQFGTYEDAIDENRQVIFHSLLTPMLNIGLLTPAEIVENILEYAEKNDIPINSTEGFIRQVIGWREFMKMVYLQVGRKQRTHNYWTFERRELPQAFYTAETGVHPVDNTIKKVLSSGYAHHIERLMILGNFMLLCEVHPDEVYRWFMELFVDAYDWVMVPNIYGMSQYADGGLITTKPYISSSNYIKKMSNYSAGDWQDTWDGLFWRFIHKNRKVFESNYRMGMMVKIWDKMKPDKQKAHLRTADEYLKKLWG